MGGIFSVTILFFLCYKLVQNSPFLSFQLFYFLFLSSLTFLMIMIILLTVQCIRSEVLNWGLQSVFKIQYLTSTLMLILPNLINTLPAFQSTLHLLPTLPYTRHHSYSMSLVMTFLLFLSPHPLVSRFKLPLSINLTSMPPPPLLFRMSTNTVNFQMLLFWDLLEAKNIDLTELHGSEMSIDSSDQEFLEADGSSSSIKLSF